MSIDELLKSQSICWRSGQPKLVEALVPEPSDLSKDDLLSLICNEVRLRDEAGQTTTLSEYQHRFPYLSAELETQWAIDALLDMREPTADLEATVGEELGGSPLQKPPAADSLPISIARYEVLRVIGRGAAGIVYEAFDANLNRSVAIKCLRSDHHGDPNQTDRFQREAETVGRLRHPNIAQVFDSGRDSSVNFIVMEYCERGTLADELVGEPLSTERALAIMFQLASAVAAAHAQGIVHRDLKPANVLLSTDAHGVIHYKVADFGLAKWLDSEVTSTTTGTVLGSPAYMPPEQASGSQSEVSFQADVYGLGAILFQLLTGRPPFLGSSIADTLHQIRYSDPLDVRQLNPQAPLELETIVSKCLSKNPLHRYESARELLDELSRFASGQPILARPEQWYQRAIRLCKRNPQVASLVAVAMGLLLIIAIGSLLSARSHRQQRNLARIARSEALASEQVALQASEKSRQDEERIRKALEATKETEARRLQILYRSLVDEAWSAFQSGMRGQRLHGLDTLKRLTEDLPYDQLSPGQQLEVRNVMAACLSQPDLRLHKQLPSDRAAGHTVDIDPSFRVLALPDQSHATLIHWLDNGMQKKLIATEEGDLKNVFSSRRWFSPCGRWLCEFLISIDLNEKEVRVWEWESERLALRCKGSSEANWCFHPHRQHFFLIHQAGIQVYDLVTGEKLRQSQDNFKNAFISLSPNGETLAVWGPGRPFALHHPDSFEIIDTVPVDDDVLFATWKSDGQELWISTAAKDVLVWHPQRGQLWKVPHGMPDSVGAIQFDSLGSMVAVTGSSRTQLINLITNSELLTFAGEALRISSQMARVVIKRDHQLLLEELVPTDCFYQWKRPVAHAEFSPSGRWLALSSERGVELLDCESLRVESNLGLDPCGPAIWSPSEDELITYGKFSHICRWPTRNTELPASSLGPPQPILLNPRLAKLGADDQIPQHDGRFCQWQSDGRFLYFSDNRHERVFRTESATGRTEMLFEQRGVHRLAVSPNGELIAVMSLPREDTTVWSVVEKKQLATFPNYGNPAFTSDGRFLCLASRDEVVVFNAQDWTETRRFPSDTVHPMHPIPLAVHPLGKLLAVAVSGARVRLLDMDTGESVQDLVYRDTDTMQWLSFCADGSKLAVTRKETFSFWDLRKLSQSYTDWVPQATELSNLTLVSAVHDGLVVPAQQVSRHQSFEIERGADLLPADRWWTAYQLLATFEALQANYPDAIGNLNYALQLVLPGDTQAQANILVRRAQYHSALGDHWASFNDLRKAIELQPNHQTAQQRLAELLLNGPEALQNEHEAQWLRSRLSK